MAINYTSLVSDAVKDIRNASPVLLMGDAVVLFHKMYSGPIKEVEASEDVREIVADYYKIENLSHPLIIEDLSSLSNSAQFLLLKLVEEAKFPIILLSTYDKVSPIILSRCKRIVKFTMAPVSSEFRSASSGQEEIAAKLSQDSDPMDVLRYERDISPDLYRYEKIMGDISAKEKVSILRIVL